MAKLPLSHYSPVFANNPWQRDRKYVSYSRHSQHDHIQREEKGRREWGRKRGLYSIQTEHRLDRAIETRTAPIYRSLLTPRELGFEERQIWAQFLLSQLVRTPTFMRYEAVAAEISGAGIELQNDRVGCQDCPEIPWISSRKWLLVVAHSDDYFIRTDNPVLLTGFIERPATRLYYPLSPRVCFVATSMPDGWDPSQGQANLSIAGIALEKGRAYHLNLCMARSAERSLILSPSQSEEIGRVMFGEVLGAYPQPPFLLHSPGREGLETAYESVRIIMSRTDGVEYPRWDVMDLE